MESPGPSDIETGIDWNRMRPEAKALLGKVGELNGYFSFCLSLLVFYPYPLGSDMGALLWSQGLEGISVSIGWEIRKLWKVWKICSGVQSGATVGDLRELLSAWGVKLGSFGKG